MSIEKYQAPSHLGREASSSVLFSHTMKGMEERRLTTLFFGNVVLESQISGTFPKMYAADMRSYWMRPSRDGAIAVPLDDLRGKITADRAKALSEKIFESVALELEKNYAGGKSQAVQELTAWLLQE